MSPLDLSLLHLGTSSWTAEGWEGTFYPANIPESQWITHYAKKFSTVEVDATFYHAPSRKTVQGWRDQTPGGFLFAAKVPQTITHERFLLDCGKETAAFLDTMSILGSRIESVTTEIRERTGCAAVFSFASAHVVFLLVPTDRTAGDFERKTAEVSRIWRSEFSVELHR